MWGRSNRRYRNSQRWRSGFERPPLWALVVIVVGIVGIAVGVVFASRPHVDPVSAQEAARMDAATAKAQAAQEASRTKVLAFVGDSWGEGTGSDGPGRGLADQTATQMGWRLNNFSEGGTGYVTDGPANFPERTPFTQRVNKVIASKPDVVIVAGGINDMERGYSEQQVRAAVTQTLTGLQQGLPGVPIIVVGPWWGNSFPTQSATMVDRVVTEVATSLSLPTVSPLQQLWITGRDDNTIPGNRIQYIGSDGHPTQAGHDYLAGRLVAYLKTLTGLPVTAPASASASASASATPVG